MGIIGDFWVPLRLLCGCAGEPTCNLQCCNGTIPVSVQYSVCNDWVTALGIAFGWSTYANFCICIAAVVIHDLYRLMKSRRKKQQVSAHDLPQRRSSSTLQTV